MTIFPCPSEQGVRKLLDQCNLPSSDLQSDHLDHFFAYGSADDLTGIVGLELFGPTALLRSLAVTDQLRGSGIGKALVAEAERYAEKNGVCELYLLTNTAEVFFARLGYASIDKSTAPEAIKQTQEFASLCPDSAVLMMKKI